eukprot:TRINITY_DN81930_c0_g1_i1.p1 TRINITY_DN81930_c0_g1~~TRINITY_DN81930_c0_g1_i1.p1  ORF type:complete len:419 (-),score=40.68 TRINITY_DN81930_c0_g1_i1:17-1273(-)
MGGNTSSQHSLGGRMPKEIAQKDEQKSEVKCPFRFEDRNAIPDELVCGPFEDFNISRDVSSTLYLIWRTATPDIYSVNPVSNADVRIVWIYFILPTLAQLFLVLVLALWEPPSHHVEWQQIDCHNSTAVEILRSQGFFATASKEACLSAASSFRMDDRTISLVQRTALFYDAVLSNHGPVIFLLRVVCCTWLWLRVRFNGLEGIRKLLDYHDFSSWFLPLKGEKVRNNIAISIPLIKFLVLLCVITIAFLIICSLEKPLEMLIHTWIFICVAEADSFLNEPLARRMASTEVKGLNSSFGVVHYLYPTYSPANAINEDGTYLDAGWYILEDEEKTGLLNDFKVRHNEIAYPHPSRRVAVMLETLLVVVPIAAVVLVSQQNGNLRYTSIGVEETLAWTDFTGIWKFVGLVSVLVPLSIRL